PAQAFWTDGRVNDPFAAARLGDDAEREQPAAAPAPSLSGWWELTDVVESAGSRPEAPRRVVYRLLPRPEGALRTGASPRRAGDGRRAAVGGGRPRAGARRARRVSPVGRDLRPGAGRAIQRARGPDARDHHPALADLGDGRRAARLLRGLRRGPRWKLDGPLP